MIVLVRTKLFNMYGLIIIIDFFFSLYVYWAYSTYTFVSRRKIVYQYGRHNAEIMVCIVCIGNNLVTTMCPCATR